MCVCVFRPGQSLLYKFLWKLIYIGQRIDQHHERRPKVEHVLASEACSMACQMTEIATRTETHLRPIAICFERFLNLLPLRVRNGRQNPFRIFVRVILVFFFVSFLISLFCCCQQRPAALHSVVVLAFVASPKRRRTQFTCDFKCEMIQIDFFFALCVRTCYCYGCLLVLLL